jgi:hypothetical protein
LLENENGRQLSWPAVFAALYFGPCYLAMSAAV